MTTNRHGADLAIKIYRTHLATEGGWFFHFFCPILFLKQTKLFLKYQVFWQKKKCVVKKNWDNVGQSKCFTSKICVSEFLLFGGHNLIENICKLIS